MVRELVAGNPWVECMWLRLIKAWEAVSLETAFVDPIELLQLLPPPPRPPPSSSRWKIISFSAKPATKDFFFKYNEPGIVIAQSECSKEAESTFHSRCKERMDGIDKGFAKYGHGSSCLIQYICYKSEWNVSKKRLLYREPWFESRRLRADQRWTEGLLSRTAESYVTWSKYSKN